MGGGSLTNELVDHFGCTADLVTTSAFVQQRQKLLPAALETLFHSFVEKTDKSALYDGYRLLAVDGSALQIPTDKNDAESFLVIYHQLALNLLLRSLYLLFVLADLFHVFK